MSIKVRIQGLEGLKKALKRNPETVIREGKKFIVRGMAVASKMMFRPPWQVGDRSGKGKGVPVGSGNLRGTHQKRVMGLKGIIYPTAPYAKYVHGYGYGEVNSRTKVTSRPWLNRIGEDMIKDVEKLQTTFLKNLTKDLAK